MSSESPGRANGRGVIMIGNLHLTTHRILFHALLPPDAVFVDESSRSPSARHSDQAMAASAHQPDILHSGPITIHRSGALKSTRRVWLELSAEMITTYPRGDEAGRVRPLRCVLCQSLANPTTDASELRETARAAGPEESMRLLPLLRLGRWSSHMPLHR